MTPTEKATAALLAATAAACSMGTPSHNTHTHVGGFEGGNISVGGSGRGVNGRPEHLKARVKGLGPGLGQGQAQGQGLGLGQGHEGSGNGNDTASIITTPHESTSLSPPRPQPPPPIGSVHSHRLSSLHPAVAKVVEQLKHRDRASQKEVSGGDVSGGEQMGVIGVDKGQDKDKDKDEDKSEDEGNTSNMQALAMRMKSSGK